MLKTVAPHLLELEQVPLIDQSLVKYFQAPCAQPFTTRAAERKAGNDAYFTIQQILQVSAAEPLAASAVAPEIPRHLPEHSEITEEDSEDSEGSESSSGDEGSDSSVSSSGGASDVDDAGTDATQAGLVHSLRRKAEQQKKKPAAKKARKIKPLASKDDKAQVAASKKKDVISRHAAAPKVCRCFLG